MSQTSNVFHWEWFYVLSYFLLCFFIKLALGRYIALRWALSTCNSQEGKESLSNIRLRSIVSVGHRIVMWNHLTHVNAWRVDSTKPTSRPTFSADYPSVGSASAETPGRSIANRLSNNIKMFLYCRLAVVCSTDVDYRLPTKFALNYTLFRKRQMRYYMEKKVGG